MMDAICIPSDQTCVQILSDVLDDPTHDLDTQIKDAPVSQFMVIADDMAYALPDTTVTECLRTLKAKNAKHLAVLSAPPSSDDSRVEGLISMKDLLLVGLTGFEQHPCVLYPECPGGGPLVT